MLTFPGQDHAAGFLRQAVASHRLAHAYAFVGPPGIGKRDAALRFATALIAPWEADWDRDDPGAAPGSTPWPNGSVGSRIAAGNHPDVRTFAPPEGKRVFNVETIEEAIDELYVTPREADRRVCIIDHAESMSQAAANTFLKTLEEPPDRAMLVLLVDEWFALLETVRSRVQAVRFRPLVGEPLKAAVEAGSGDAEPIDADTFAKLAPLAQGSPGAFRTLQDEEFLLIRQQLGKLLLAERPLDPVTAAEEIQAATRLERDTTQEPQRRRLQLALGQALVWWRDAIVQRGTDGAADMLDPGLDPNHRIRLARSVASTGEALRRVDALFEIIEDLLGNMYIPLWTVRLADRAGRPTGAAAEGRG